MTKAEEQESLTIGMRICSPRRPASRIWGRPGPTSPQRECTTSRSKPQELKTLACHKMCWCGPGNPFLKHRADVTHLRGSYTCVWTRVCVTLLRVRLSTFNAGRGAFYLLYKGQNQQFLHIPLYPEAGYPTSNLCKLKHIHVWNLFNIPEAQLGLSLTCTQSYGHVKTAVPTPRRQHKTWGRQRVKSMFYHTTGSGNRP